MTDQRAFGRHLLPIKSGIFAELQSQTEEQHTTLNLELDTERPLEEFMLYGTHLTVLSAPKGFTFNLFTNEPTTSPFLMKNASTYRGIFYRFFISHSTSVSGGVLSLFVGNNIDYRFDAVEIDDSSIISRLTSIRDDIQKIEQKSVLSTFSSTSVISHLVSGGSTINLLPANPHRRPLTIHNTSHEDTVFFGTNSLNALLPIPPLSERSFVIAPFYTGDIFIRNPSSSPVSIITFEGFST